MREHKRECLFLNRQLYGEIIMYIHDMENKLESQSGSGSKKKPLSKMPELYKKLIKEGQNPLNHITFGWTSD